jgi:hypothetical protein
MALSQFFNPIFSGFLYRGGIALIFYEFTMRVLRLHLDLQGGHIAEMEENP